MPFYHRLGTLPRTRHTVFRAPDGHLYSEELMGNRGFSGLSSLLYHLHPPTQVREADPIPSEPWTAADRALRPRHLRTGAIPPGGDPVTARRPLLYNADVALEVVHPTEAAPWLYRNGQADEVVFITEGGGVLESVFGRIAYGKGDYLVVPRGIVHRLVPGPGIQRYFVIESRGPVRVPARYRNEYGQLLEWAPFAQRDLRAPEALDTVDEEGAFEVRVKQSDRLFRYIYARHPFDVAGWDGYYFPWAFNVADFQPLVGRVHQPPPVHQVFEGDGFVVCNFVPRLYDFHPDAIPVPYNHTNAQSDEVIYYASEKFMSRRGVEQGSITLHPDGIPHGPHPGTVEESLGRTRTEELAVMVDTFRPLTLARDAAALEDPEYIHSWLEGHA